MGGLKFDVKRPLNCFKRTAAEGQSRRRSSTLWI
jgi:hypothetical protein